MQENGVRRARDFEVPWGRVLRMKFGEKCGTQAGPIYGKLLLSL